MAMRFTKNDLSYDSGRLESLLVAIDSVIFGDDLEASNLEQFCNDENLKLECLAWRKRFSEPDTEIVKNKW